MAEFAYRFLADDYGATAIEYALIAGGIALAVIATVFLVGENLLGMYESVDEAFPD